MLMKMLKYGLIGIVLLIAIVAVVGLFMPSEWKVEREVTIQADIATVHAVINDLKTHPEWMTWKDEDPDMKIEYGEVSVGEGATSSWGGGKSSGTLTVTKSDPAKGMWYTMDIEGMTAEGSFTYEKVDGGTKVKWTDYAEVNYMGRYFVPMIEGMLGEHFENSLNNLKTHITDKAN